MRNSVRKPPEVFEDQIGTLESHTRSRPHTPAPGVLDLLKKKVAWGKEIDRNHLFSYENIEEMIEEAEQRVASLRQSTTAGGEEK